VILLGMIEMVTNNIIYVLLFYNVKSLTFDTLLEH
jgi:hypothetical protein